MNEMTPEQIRAALDAGIITPAQARTMRAQYDAAHNENSSTIGDEDQMRFIRGFSDVFIAIGLTLLAFGMAAFAGLMGGGLIFLVALGVMALAAIYFGRKKRAHLPTLICALSVLFFTQGLFSGLLGGGALMTALLTAATMIGFYMVVRFPFCMALIAISLVYVVFALLGDVAPQILRAHTGWVMALTGSIVLCVALYYDSRDEHRTTRFADNAFWLHLTAAPLLIHGLVVELVRSRAEPLMGLIDVPVLDKGDAVLVLAGVAILTIFGLAINRRALIISSLGYAGFALVFLMQGSSLSLGLMLSLTLLILGGAIVLLGTAWHPVRNGIIKVLPKWGIFPPPYNPNYKAE